MIFNSLPFAIFFTVFFILYWTLAKGSARHQNLLLLIGSYFFYAWWNVYFLTLLIASTALIYFLGIGIARSEAPGRKKLLLKLGIILMLGLLFVFKYYNFFVHSLITLLEKFSVKINFVSLNLILPLGISFYSFRLMSYLLDVYYGKFKATSNWLEFSAYVSFFPSLISGPIDKSKLLLPQLEKRRTFDYNQASNGLWQIIWGLFKKIVIADNIAILTNDMFGDYQSYSGSVLLLAAFFYAIQLYADFSGYSDIAIGIARLLGLNITKNFNFPFFAQNIADFWRRWHMSLTSWLTEYLFTPLSISFRNMGQVGLILAIVINFVVCGIWHGANWTYVVFGFLHGCYFIPLILKGTMNKKQKLSADKALPSLKEFANMAGTFILVMLTWIFFRANTVGEAFQILKKIFSTSLLSIPRLRGEKNTELLISMLLALLLLFTDWRNRNKDFAFENMHLKSTLYRILLLAGMLVLFYYFSVESSGFIYFQF
jgi:alginate O-acetyltransferase complex protein AlgI